MLSLADNPLVLPTREIIDLVQEMIDPREHWRPFLPRAWAGLGCAALAYPTGVRTFPRVKLGTFSYPSGASRFAYGYFLCTSTQLEKIKTAAFGQDGTEQNAIELVMKSNGLKSDESLETDVFLLPPVPLAGLQGTESNQPSRLYLLTVVDERFYWWSKPCPDLGIQPGNSIAWEGVFSQLAEALDIEIEVDDVDGAYLECSDAFMLEGEPIPVVLDAACANVGHRFIRTLDGDFATQKFATAQTAHLKDAKDNPDRTIRSGGDFMVLPV